MRVRTRTNTRAISIGLAAFAAAASLCSAQTPMPLSLKRAVEIALAPDGNTRVALAQESIQQAKTQQAQSRAAFLPDLDSSVQDHREVTNLQAFGLKFNIPPSLGFAIPTIVGPFTIFDARVTAQQSLFNFADLRRYRASKISAEATATDAVATRNSVSDEVARDYLACLRADTDRTTARANVDLSEALLTLARRQKDAGTGTGIEVTRAEVQLANDRQSLIQAENNRNRATLTLLKAMGLRLDASVEFTNKLEFKPVETASDAALVDQAIKTRPELKTQRQREDAARMTLGSIKDERLPSVGASADYGTIGTDIASAHPTYTLGVSLRVPIFDGGRREARIGESASQLRQEQLRTRDIGQQIDLQVRTALDSLRSAAAEVQAATEGQMLSESELAQARRRYEAGVATGVEVTDAQTRLQRARDNLTRALYDHNVARLDLATATGTIGDYVNQ